MVSSYNRRLFFDVVGQTTDEIGVVGSCHLQHSLQIPGTADRNRLAEFKNVVFADFAGNVPDIAPVDVDDLMQGFAALRHALERGYVVVKGD